MSNRQSNVRRLYANRRVYRAAMGAIMEFFADSTRPIMTTPKLRYYTHERVKRLVARNSY